MTAPPADPLEADARARAEIGRLERRVADLEQQIHEAREELRVARNYADTDAAGYIDRTELEGL